MYLLSVNPLCNSVNFQFPWLPANFGRATYHQPFLLRESTTVKLADFTTHFRFVIDSQNKIPYADGLTFLLAPNGSIFNRTLVMDGSLGLPVENLPGYMPRSSQYPFVAVDFDIFTNKEESIDDPEWEHYLPDLVIAGFSATTATSGVAFTLHKIVSWDFTSTYLDDYETKTNPTSNYNLLLFVALGAGGGFVLVGAAGFVWFILWKFSYNKLVRATSNFVERENLGEGGFGGVYKGFIKDLNSYVAVKRISYRNLVQLIGWCHEKGELLLIYEFMPNGSLDFHLFRAKSLLVWEVRYKIVQGLASGLFYLHQGWEQCVLHRDIKSSKVMLDANLTAKLGNFGLARLVDHGKQSKTTTLAGTMGYKARLAMNLMFTALELLLWR
ncbi:hypothetical protein ACFX10_030756 [Malus domestica]